VAFKQRQSIGRKGKNVIGSVGYRLYYFREKKMADDSATLDWLSLINPINHSITGSRDEDVLSAKADGDIVSGLAGHDHLNSEFNRTALIGGGGDDELTTKVVVPLQNDAHVNGLAIQLGGTGNDDLNATVTLKGDIPPISTTELRADVLIDGGNGDDVIHATANAEPAIFGTVTFNTEVIGGRGNDTIDAVADGRGAHGDSILTNSVDGGSGNDHITAYAQSDFSGFHATITNQLFGGAGDDIMDATALGQSNSTRDITNELHGGVGDDVMRAYNLTTSNDSTPVGINQLWGDDGNDTIIAEHRAVNNTISDVTNYVDGGKGSDNLTANIDASNSDAIHAVNQLEGGNGQDILTANFQGQARGDLGLDAYDVANVLNGGAGDDLLTAFLSATLDPLSAPDLYASSTAENHLDGGAGNDVLAATVASGSIGSSFLSGGAGHDHLTVFGGAANILDGGDGKDILTSGTGNDSMIGGAGADTLVFAAQNGHDNAEFEQGRDIIDLTGYNNIDDFSDLNIEVAGANSIIHFDASNDLTVTGVSNLTADDFLFA
jgi:Ca2+-binding RTX toxin-like protein